MGLIKKKQLISFDLDNTLWNFTRYYTLSMKAAIEKIVILTGIDEANILEEISEITTRYQNLEYSFIFEELPCLKGILNKDGPEKYEQSLQLVRDAFDKKRRACLQFYPNVYYFLQILDAWRTYQRQQGNACEIIAVTDSGLYTTLEKLDHFHLANYFDKIYCRESEKPTLHIDADMTARLEQYIKMQVGLDIAVRQTRKPDPIVLQDIANERGYQSAEITHIGDSLRHDVVMAQESGCTDVLAAYGTRSSEEAAFLDSISLPYHTHVNGDPVIPTYKIADILQFPPIVIPDYERRIYSQILTQPLPAITEISEEEAEKIQQEQEGNNAKSRQRA